MSDPRPRELRLALGMRGGVSLAVWIGGACAEIDRLRRSRDEPPSFWSKLADATGYERVIVDVMAGASAGGLNGVLYAASQIYDFPYEGMRKVWLDVGGTDQLVRRTSPWPSLFKGDEHFFEQVYTQLTAFTGDAPDERDRQPPTVDLRLSATHVEPISRPVRSPGDEELRERRFGSGFRFVNPPYAWLPGDFPAAHATSDERRAEFDRNLSRLALAARATSSYPAAFEPAIVRSSRAPSFSPVPTGPASRLDVDMSGIFADRAGEEDRTFVVADGGIIDNIPLGRALDAVAGAPADGPTDRYLVYLHPGAPNPPLKASQAAIADRRTALGVLRATIGARLQGEDIHGDIAQIEEHNEAVARAVAVRRATFAGVTAEPEEALPDAEAATVDQDLVATAKGSRASYVAMRVDEDVRLIRHLLDDPWTALGGDDPFPKTAGGRGVKDDEWRSPIARWPREQREALAARLQDGFSNRLQAWEKATSFEGRPVFEAGARPLLRTTQTLLQWCRYLETRGVVEASEAKKVLYRVLAFVEAVIDWPRQLGWVALVAAAKPAVTADEVVGKALEGLGVLTKRSADDVDRVCQALLSGDDDQTLHAECERSVSLIDPAVERAWGEPHGGGPPADADEVDLRVGIATDVLLPVSQRLLDDASGIGAGPSDDDPGAELHRVLRDKPITLEVLAALEVLCLGEYAAGLPGRRPIQFVRLSAANATPLAPCFSALFSKAEELGLWWDPDVRSLAEQAGIHVFLKLAGNELANFSAFLRPAWRANDWMWGRMDAVPTLVELMVSPGSIRRGLPDPAGRMAFLERLVVGDPADPLHDLCRTKVWEQYRTRIEAELTALADTDEDAPVRLVCLREALVARRQWEILASDLVDFEPDLDLPAKVADYAVGAETVRDAAYRKEVLARFDEIALAASQTLVTNIQASPAHVLGTSQHPRRLRTWIVRSGVRWGTRIGARRYLRSGAKVR